MIITIDGASCSGKGSVSMSVAHILNFSYLDSGAFYRSFALWVHQNNLSLEEIEQKRSLVENIDIVFNKEGIFLNGENVSNVIRDEKIGVLASKFASHAATRSILLDKQQNFAVTHKNLVADGRDMGTVIFPHAEIKIFLISDVRIRANRRYEQLRQENKHVSLDRVLADIKKRDDLDKNRDFSPLVAAKDAVIIDSSDLSLEKTVDKVMQYVYKIQG